MANQKIFAVVGGDERQACLANLLARREKEHQTYALCLDRGVQLSSKVLTTDDLHTVLAACDAVFFPIPMTEGSKINTPLSDRVLGVEECLGLLSPDAVAIAGRVPDAVAKSAGKKGITIHDYLSREEFAVQNAVPTAEGAIEIALRELPVTLFNSRCVVIGYGRIAKVLTRLLKAFGAKVCVAARNHTALTWAEIDGATPVHLSNPDDCLKEADVVFNTVPATMLGESELGKLKRHCLVIDLASKPGGIDWAAAERLQLQTIWALSLPGKVAPVSAGTIMLNTAYNIFGERGFQI